MRHLELASWLVATAAGLAQQREPERPLAPKSLVARLGDPYAAPVAIDELAAMGAQAGDHLDAAWQGASVARRSAFVALEQMGPAGIPHLPRALQVLLLEGNRAAFVAGLQAVGTLALHADPEQREAVRGFVPLVIRDAPDACRRISARLEAATIVDQASLSAMLEARDLMQREAAADLLARQGNARVLPELDRALRDWHGNAQMDDFTLEVQTAAARAIVRIAPGRDGSAAAYARLLRSPFRRERIDAAIALAALAVPRPDRDHVGNALTKALMQRDPEFLRHLMVAAGTLGLKDPAALRRMRVLANGNDRELAAIATATLKGLAK